MHQERLWKTGNFETLIDQFQTVFFQWLGHPLNTTSFTFDTLVSV
jgi:hypothetical protein